MLAALYFFAFQLFFCENLFLIYKEKRKLYPLRLLGAIIVLSGCTYLFSLITYPNLLLSTFTYILILIVTFCCNIFVYRITIYDSIFSCSAGYALQNGIFSLVTVFNFFVPAFRELDIGYVISNYILYSILPYLIIGTGFYFLVVHKKAKRGDFEFQNWKALIFLILVLFVTVFLSVLMWYSYGEYVYNPFTVNVVCRSLSVICCFTILFLQLALCTINRKERDIDMLNYMVEMQKEQYSISKKTIDLINVKFHDLKHEISRIEMLEEKERSEKIEELKKQASVYSSIAKTGNASLDLVLMEKNLLCNKYDIGLSYLVNDENALCFMTQSDVFSLMGNALDNAIDELKNIDDKDKKFINLVISRRIEGQVSIHIENYCQNKVKFVNGLPVSTKGDTNYHGFGTKSIKLIAEKYNGITNMSYKDHIFSLDIMIPITK